MANPNNIIKSSQRKMSLIFEEVKNTSIEADILKSELKLSGKYDVVKITTFKIGKKSSKLYAYSVRGYKK